MAKKSVNISQQLKKLISLLSDDDYHSGTSIGETLGLTRSGVWKLIKQLEELGVVIESITNRGYKLHKPIELLDKNQIKKHLIAKTADVDKILIFDDLPSTNTYLLENAYQFYGENVLCLAERQTAGRGRLGREWLSPFASNIYFSLLWNFPFNLSQLSGLNIVIGVAIAECIKEVTGLKEIELKWPNDVLFQGKKLGGVLIDIIGEYNGGCCAVIGIGINVSMPDACRTKLSKPWTDLYTITNKHISRNQVIGMLLARLIAHLAAFPEKGMLDFIRNWNTMDYLFGKETTVKSGKHLYRGRVKGIDQLGHLVLETQNGETMIATTGDVTVSSIKKIADKY